jgi:hypothetical protein
MTWNGPAVTYLVIQDMYLLDESQRSNLAPSLQAYGLILESEVLGRQLESTMQICFPATFSNYPCLYL